MEKKTEEISLYFMFCLHISRSICPDAPDGRSRTESADACPGEEACILKQRGLHEGKEQDKSAEDQIYGGGKVDRAEAEEYAHVPVVSAS